MFTNENSATRARIDRHRDEQSENCKRREDTARVTDMEAPTTRDNKIRVRNNAINIEVK